jgi:hypothetical protein
VQNERVIGLFQQPRLLSTATPLVMAQCSVNDGRLHGRYPETQFAYVSSDVREPDWDFWPGITSGLLVIHSLSSHTV